MSDNNTDARARKALIEGERLAEMGVPVTWGEVRALHSVIRDLLSRLEQSEAVTDEKVEAALCAWVESAIGGASFDAMADYLKERNRPRMRAALIAASQTGDKNAD